MADTIALEPTGQSAQVVKPTPVTPPVKPVAPAPVIATDPSAHSDQVQKMSDMPSEYYPLYGVTSFVELEELQAAQDAAHEVGELTQHFQIIVSNIMANSEIANKTVAVNRVTAEFTARLDGAASRKEKKPNFFEKLVKAITGSNEQPEIEPVTEPHSSFTVWKDKETGGYRWLAVYSNNFRDQDNPPEIISEQSHKSFVDLVDGGAAPMPELWHWHIPGTRWGIADWVDYADGFALASGTVDTGHEKEAESLAQMDGLRVSHGMPSRFIVRNKEDSSIIDFHVTSEISPLPGWAAANALTEFVVLNNKEYEMAFTAEKRKYLVQAGLDEGAINELESNLANKAQAAKQAGIEHKETTPAVDAAAPPAEIEQPAVEAPAYTTAQDVADAVSAVMTPMMAMLTSMNDRMGAVESEVKELRADDSEKIAKAAAGTPRASLQDLIAQSLSGMAPLDGRTSLAKAGPKEAEPEIAGATPSPLLNGLMNKARGGG